MCNTHVPWHAQITWHIVVQLSWGWQACEPLCTVTAHVTCDTAGMRVPCMKGQPVILQVPRVISRMRDRVTCTVFMTQFCTQCLWMAGIGHPHREVSGLWISLTNHGRELLSLDDTDRYWSSRELPSLTDQYRQSGEPPWMIDTEHPEREALWINVVKRNFFR
jgi:hypothetical protein